MDAGFALTWWPPVWWHWCLIGLIFLGLEVFAPGAVFVWIGVGALITGALTGLLGIASWQAQCLLFILLSFAALFLGRRFIRRAAPASHPTLNKRLAQYVGRDAELEEAVVGGVGKVRLGDTLWRVRGPDAPAGAKVTVIDVSGSDLVVALKEGGERPLPQMR